MSDTGIYNFSRYHRLKIAKKLSEYFKWFSVVFARLQSELTPPQVISSCVLEVLKVIVYFIIKEVSNITMK